MGKSNVVYDIRHSLNRVTRNFINTFPKSRFEDKPIDLTCLNEEVRTGTGKEVMGGIKIPVEVLADSQEATLEWLNQECETLVQKQCNSIAERERRDVRLLQIQDTIESVSAL